MSEERRQRETRRLPFVTIINKVARDILAVLESYLLAKDLELQHHYEQALEEYRAIDKEDPGFEDVRARTSQLEASIDEAGKSYEAGLEAEKNGEIEAAIEAFVDALLFYPGYKDSAERLAKLRS